MMPCPKGKHCDVKDCPNSGHNECNRGKHCPYLKKGTCKKDHTICLNSDKCPICLPKPVAAVLPVVANEYSGGGGGQFIQPAIKVCPRGMHCHYEKDGTCKKNHTGCPYGDNCSICKKPPVAAATTAVLTHNFIFFICNIFGWVSLIYTMTPDLQIQVVQFNTFSLEEKEYLSFCLSIGKIPSKYELYLPKENKMLFQILYNDDNNEEVKRTALQDNKIKLTLENARKIKYFAKAIEDTFLLP